MKRPDKFEQDMLKAYAGGVLKSISPTKADLIKFKAVASATFIKERRVNIRLSSPDLMGIQALALEGRAAVSNFHCKRSAQVCRRPPRREAITSNISLKRTRHEAARRLAQKLSRAG